MTDLLEAEDIQEYQALAESTFFFLSHLIFMRWVRSGAIPHNSVLADTVRPTTFRSAAAFKNIASTGNVHTRMHSVLKATTGQTLGPIGDGFNERLSVISSSPVVDHCRDLPRFLGWLLSGSAIAYALPPRAVKSTRRQHSKSSLYLQGSQRGLTFGSIRTLETSERFA